MDIYELFFTEFGFDTKIETMAYKKKILLDLDCSLRLKMSLIDS